MKYVRVLLAAVCLLSAEAGLAQQDPEQPMGTGFEPAVNCDRDTTTSGKRIQFLWMNTYGMTPGIYWTISHALGAVDSWSEPVVFPKGVEARVDPFTVCNIWSDPNTATRHMYFGWYTQFSSQGGNPLGDYFRRSLRDIEVDNPARMEDGMADRPWLAANNASLYLSFRLGDPFKGYVKRAAIPSGESEVIWPSGPGVEVFVADSNTTLVSNFPVAAHADSVGNERAFLMARQYGSGSGLRDNSIRIQRSLNQGAWGNEETVIVQGVDGFPVDRDLRMLSYHIASDPRTSAKQVYAFYVRNEAAPYISHGGKRNVLYCKPSLNGGDSWNGESKVFTISPSDLPSNGFAVVPPNDSPGFYRIGRVWSCVDDNGNVYVAWMDNRYGKYDTTNKDYWHVFCSRSIDLGEHWSPPIRVSGTDQVTASASIGGYGNPGFNPDHVPPGDVLTCDADLNRLYVAWPDSRDNQLNTGAPTKVYFRRIQF